MAPMRGDSADLVVGMSGSGDFNGGFHRDRTVTNLATTWQKVVDFAANPAPNFGGCRHGE
jgi:hypothetical protein